MKEKIYHPQLEHSAKNMGSGGLEVLSTPALVAFMENLAYEVLQENLPKGQSSVGTQMNIEHLVASPIHQTIRIQINEWKKEGRKHMFTLQAYANQTLLATAQHTRYIVDVERFLGKLN